MSKIKLPVRVERYGKVHVLFDAEGSFLAKTDGIEAHRLPSSLEAIADALNASVELLAALGDLELRMTQTILASNVGKKKDRTDFLRGQLERMRGEARAAITKASVLSSVAPPGKKL
jgi:hypothetical protein